MTLLWYLHDHGSGHLGRARAVIPHLDTDVVVAAGPGVAAAAAAALDVQVVELPADHCHPDPPTQGPWHHAPATPAMRQRAEALTDIVRRWRCEGAVVDLSVEVTVLCRLLGLSTVTLRQSGRRNDLAHQIGLESANTVWVPQHRELEFIDTPVDERWSFSGAFSRFDNLCPPRNGNRRRAAKRRLVLLTGRGGSTLTMKTWRVASAPRGWEVLLVGDHPVWSRGDVASLGYVEPVWDVLRHADVVITGGGWSSVADVVAAGAALVIVPEPRPFDEQCTRAAALADAGLAVALPRWPSPQQVHLVVEEALALDRLRWHQYYDRRGAQRAAEIIGGALG